MTENKQTMRSNRTKFGGKEDKRYNVEGDGEEAIKTSETNRDGNIKDTKQITQKEIMKRESAQEKQETTRLDGFLRVISSTEGLR